MEGWLIKRSGLPHIWHRRYCVIKDDGFFIYLDESKTKLTNSFVITPKSQVSLIETRWRVGFKITQPEGKIFSFQVKDNKDFHNWLSHILVLSIPENTTKIKEYKIISELGRGFYGKVVLARHKETGKFCAIKSIHKKSLVDMAKVDTIMSEREILKTTKSPFIVSLLSSFQTPSKFYLVLEYVSGGDLFQHMSKSNAITVDQIKLYTAEIATALQQLHKERIIYRDLKPENILICEDGHIKLTDFGISKMLDSDKDTTKTLCGTSEYLAPEVIQGKEYTEAIDWWQVGILLYEMFAGRTPFEDPNRTTLYSNILNKNPNYFPITDENTRTLIASLLKKDPTKRAGYNEIRNSKFFEGFNWTELDKRTSYVLPKSVSSSDGLNNLDKIQTSEAEDSDAPPVLQKFGDFEYTNPEFDV
ncbi:AGC family protein kinase [Trichomonas vaginalis G3]|uniref:AGC family protein kinase n=1 Tax=Trichomonas vaginalis (strain ATCC PRA-98 / G3) TaxID=412133 RepID=A2FKC9_TRIV3|nr:protein serine/threonine kinase protein [Trichomonas vaginalis G3]EAX94629.1 AGC family protein kinase [Trichomonas vaginalis G3]KAI5494767.1 protein serine/threonine kinase protein [Trichomonas vaginalis G3]|eukprot:XP_001307559.1 AGC family protein kinase [Trichomonas vaginalis G3]